MVEEEDKTPDDEMAKLREAWRAMERELLMTEVKQQQARLAKHKEELKEKKLFNENMEQLFAQMDEVYVEMGQLLQSDKDWEEVKPEFDEKSEYLGKLDEELEEQEDWAERAELAGKTFDELLDEIFLTEEKIIQLVKKKDTYGKQLQRELGRFNRVQLALVKKPKKIGDYLKWARALEAKSLVYLDVEDRNLKEFKKTLDKTIANLNNIKLLKKNAAGRGLSMGEYLQWETVASLKEMNFKNYQLSVFSSRLSIMNSIPPNQFQAAVTDTMMDVRKNTSTLRQFILVVLASAVGAPLVQNYVIPVFEKRPSLLVPVGVGLVVVIGLFVLVRWAIINRVIRIRVVKKS